MQLTSEKSCGQRSVLKRVVRVYLLAVGIWMVVEGVAHAEHTLLEPRGRLRWTLAALVGFLIAAASGGLGVAGGEMRIPALMYLFAVPVKEAGTIFRPWPRERSPIGNSATSRIG
jgi:uncharacterized membrane protein YfcA